MRNEELGIGNGEKGDNSQRKVSALTSSTFLTLTSSTFLPLGKTSKLVLRSLNRKVRQISSELDLHSLNRKGFQMLILHGAGLASLTFLPLGNLQASLHCSRLIERVQILLNRGVGIGGNTVGGRGRTIGSGRGVHGRRGRGGHPD